ncbi:hypothetical protein BHM03_00061579 [Ensete ventricosum]|nr:hypothetical protein BHM03_00061579 [Ensete ventricosum]
MRRRRLPWHAGSRPAKVWPPLRLAPSPLLAVGLVASGHSLRAPCSRPPLRAPHCKRLCPRATVAPAIGAVALGWGVPPCTGTAPTRATALAGGNPGCGYCPRRRQPCPRAGAHAGGNPCKGLWPWVADTAWGLAVVGRPSSSLPSGREENKRGRPKL